MLLYPLIKSLSSIFLKSLKKFQSLLITQIFRMITQIFKKVKLFFERSLKKHSETSDYADYRKITPIVSTIKNLCNPYFICVIRDF